MDFIPLIGDLGFPIACVIACGVFIKQIWSEQKENNEKIMLALFKSQEVNSSFVKVLESYQKDIEGIKDNIQDIKTAVMK